MKPSGTVPAHLNPFRSERVEALSYRGPDVSPSGIIENCRRQHHGRGALTGPKGSGKTTLLLEIARHLCAQGKAPLLIRLNETDRRVDWRTLRLNMRLTHPPPLLLDGAEQLSLFAWWRLRRLARRTTLLVITSHHPGKLPTLHDHRTTPELLATLVRELLDGPEADIPSTQDLTPLFERHGGDIRQCLRELYDDVAKST